MRATEKLVALDRKTAKDLVDAVVKMGGMVQMVRDRLPHGEFVEWLEDGARVEPRTAQRYMAVAQWATERPDEFEKVKSLSITKIYRLLTVPPELRRRLYGRRVSIPGTDKRLFLADMTVVHLDRVLGDLAPAEPTSDVVPKLLQSAHHRIASLDAMTTELIEHRRHVDAEDIEQLHAELVEVAERIEEAFSL